MDDRSRFCVRVAVMTLSITMLGSEWARADVVQTCIDAADRGQNARDAGHWLEARAAFAQCAAEGCPTAVTADCVRWLDDLDRQIPKIVIAVADERGVDRIDARVAIDQGPLQRLDGRPIEVDPGRHEIHVERAGAPDFVSPLLARAGEGTRVARLVVSSETPAAKPSTSSSSIPTMTFVLGGIGIAALGTSVGFDLSTQARYDSLASSCSPACGKSDVSDLKTRALVADISLGVGIAAIVASAAFWIFHRQ